MSRGEINASVFRSLLYQNHYNPLEARRQLVASSKDSLDYVQRLALDARFKIHEGCVNTVVWNNNGRLLLSGSDDQCLVVTDAHRREMLLRYKTIHRANIFSAKFLPQSNDLSIVSCSGDGIVLHTELMSPYIKRRYIRATAPDADPNMSAVGLGDLNLPLYEFQSGDMQISCFNCHRNGTAYEVLTLPYQPKCFMSCGEDGTVRLFDLRQISGCHKTCCKDNVIIFSPSTVNAMDLSPITNNYVAVGSSDGLVRVYDRRYLKMIDFNDTSVSTRERHTMPVKVFGIPAQEKRQYRITCVQYSSMEDQILASYSSEYLYLFDVNHPGSNVKQLSKPPRDAKDVNKCENPGTIMDGDEALINRAIEISNSGSSEESSEQVTRRLRLRGDWSDTGPDARPETDSQGVVISQVRPQLQHNILTRMTDVIARLLNDPQTRGNLFTIGSDIQRNVESAATQIIEDERGPMASSFWRSAAFRGGDRLMAMPGQVSRLRVQRQQNTTTPAPPTPTLTTPSTSPTSSTPQNENHDDPMTSSCSNSTSSSSSPSTSSSAMQINGSSSELNAEEELVKAYESNKSEEAKTKKLYEYIRMKYMGHRNARTMIKEACFWGSNYIMSGSDCGHIFIWDKNTGKLVKILQADKHVVNCLQPHPDLPYLASSGIDYDVKLWAPVAEKPEFDLEQAEELVKRNAVMLEQTKDTITVPASFLIRMLACIHTLRSRNLNNNNARTDGLSGNGRSRRDRLGSRHRLPRNTIMSADGGAYARENNNNDDDQEIDVVDNGEEDNEEAASNETTTAPDVTKLEGHEPVFVDIEGPSTSAAAAGFVAAANNNPVASLDSNDSKNSRADSKAAINPSDKQ